MLDTGKDRIDTMENKYKWCGMYAWSTQCSEVKENGIWKSETEGPTHV